MCDLREYISSIFRAKKYEAGRKETENLLTSFTKL
jgi:hypothetical protein